MPEPTTTRTYLIGFLKDNDVLEELARLNNPGGLLPDGDFVRLKNVVFAYLDMDLRVAGHGKDLCVVEE